LEKKNRGMSFLGIDPTLGIGDKILDYADIEKERLDKSNYHAICPSCGKRQIKSSLLVNGCFICGWRGGAEEVDLAKVKKSFSISAGLEEGCEGYKMRCPDCGASLITEEFKTGGCYICGCTKK
jgi:predicted RNA-binding Zn-ribbon protein involved in translation (DUF1610 family)